MNATPQQMSLAQYYARPTMQQVTPNQVTNLPAQRGVAQQFGYQSPQPPPGTQGAQQFALNAGLQAYSNPQANNAAAFQAAANQFNQGQFQGSPQISALAKQMAANQALQRQIGFNGAGTQQPAGFLQGQQMMPGMPQQAQPGAPVGMAAAAPQTTPGVAQPYRPMQAPTQPFGGGLGGAAGSLARYYMR